MSFKDDANRLREAIRRETDLATSLNGHLVTVGCNLTESGLIECPIVLVAFDDANSVLINRISKGRNDPGYRVHRRNSESNAGFDERLTASVLRAIDREERGI